jgi:hypothetical protein
MVIGRDGNAKSTGIKIKPGEGVGKKAMRKSGEDMKGTANTKAEEADELRA